MLTFLGKMTRLVAIGLLPTLMFVLAPLTASAEPIDIKSNLECGVDLDLDASGGCSPEEGATQFQSLAVKVLNYASLLLGGAAVIMFFVAGGKYIFSGGAPDKVKSVHQSIMWGVIGVVVVVVSQVFVKFVLVRVSPI